MLRTFLEAINGKTEKEKFNNIYAVYRDILYFVAFNKTNNVQDAEESVQETFFYIAKNLSKIDDIKSQRTKCFLVTIVTGFAIDIHKKSLESNLIHLDDEIDTAYFDDFEKVDLLSAFNAVLDEESRIFLYLKYSYGYKSKEIAKMYEVSDSYVRKKIQRAKETLRKKL